MTGLRYALTGWSACSFGVYAQAWREYGGSINMHPDIVRFFMRDPQMRFTFWQYRHQGRVTAALFRVNDRSTGLAVSDAWPVSADEVMFPIAPEQKVWLPAGPRRLSPALRHNVRNAVYLCPPSRRICRAKTAFSAELNAMQANEWRKFLAMGRACYRLADIPPAETAALYVALCRQHPQPVYRMPDRRRTAAPRRPAYDRRPRALLCV